MHLEQLWSRLNADLTAAFRHYRQRLSSLAVTEKADHTLLTAADVAIQDLIITQIRLMDPGALVIAEEDNPLAARTADEPVPGRVWVIDPIDGTSQFVDPSAREFCSVVCVVDHGEPTAVFVLAPELHDGGSLLITADTATGAVIMNGRAATSTAAGERSLKASVTGRGTEATAAFRGRLVDAGYSVKTKATSQTVDLIRTSVDLADVGLARTLPPFDVFRREQQKIWDGLAGLCLARILGLATVDADGRPRLPLTARELASAEPSFDCTIVGRPEVLQWCMT